MHAAFFSVIKFTNMINAISNHFVRLFKVIRDAEMRAACMVSKNKIVAVGKNDLYHS